MYKRLIVTFLILAGALLPAFAQQAHEVFYLNNRSEGSYLEAYG